MSANYNINYPSLGSSVIKTSDLLYVFCATSWVNVVTGLSTNGLHLYAFILLACTFSMIPLEIYTSSLWQQAKFLIDKDPSDDATQHAQLAALDIFRVFCLTISFSYLFVPLKAVKADIPSDALIIASTEIFIWAVGLFLLMNFFWNNLLFISRPSDGSSTKVDFYEQFFTEYKKEVLSGITEADNHVKRSISSTDMFKNTNRFIFQRIFPVFGLVLVISVTLNYVIRYFSDNNYQIDKFFMDHVWAVSIIIFSSQVIMKLYQILFVSRIVSDVKQVRARKSGGA